MKKVAVLFGGQSSEHSVSCLAVSNVVKSLISKNFEVYPIGITKNGQWTYVTPDRLDYKHNSDKLSVLSSKWTVGLPKDCYSKMWTLSSLTSIQNFTEIDIVFPLLHGFGGEDGTIQGIFEFKKIPYVGSSLASSSICMDKNTTKILLNNAGFEVARWVFINKYNWISNKKFLLEKIYKEIKFPCFVKPSRMGSSVGVKKVNEYRSLEHAIEYAKKYDSKVLVEEYINGREIECSILENNSKIEASLPAEITVKENIEFYDFATKYINVDDSSLDCPPVNFSEENTIKIQNLAKKAFKVLDLDFLARVDFFYTKDGRFIFNEINTMPGFTKKSGFPYMWQNSGIRYNELLSILVESGIQRYIN